MNFIQTIPNLHLYFAQKADGSISTTIAYLANRLSGSTITLDDAWGDQGCFIFLRQTLFDWQGFYRYLTTTLNVLNTNTRLLWINTLGQLDTTHWTNIQLRAENQSGNTATINTPQVLFLYRNYGLCVQSGCTLSLNDTMPGFTITPQGTSDINFTADKGINTVSKIDSISIQADEDYGILQFQTSLNNSNFAQLNVGINYFYPDSTTPGNIEVLSFPVFNIQNNVTLFGNLNPCKNDRLSDFSLLLNDPSLGQAQTFKSNFVTNTGYPVYLQATQTSGLVLAVQPSTTTPSANDPYYLVPTGNFILSSQAPSSTALQLMPGLCGVEFIQTDDSQPSSIEFIPGCNAYAPNFPTAGTGNVRLNNTATTAWGYVHGGGDQLHGTA